jgi:putative endonuclease
MPSAYILYSKSKDRYYIGFTTETIALRLERHNNDYYDDKSTADGKPWDLFLDITCDTNQQARSIESQIKSMKSRKYVENLRKYPEMIDKLKERYKDC